MKAAGGIGAPAGFSGPLTVVNSRLAISFWVPAASAAGCCQTGSAKRKIRLVGLADDCGKWRASSAWPAAESLPAGAAVLPPKPEAV